jgi:hypothetical protein
MRYNILKQKYIIYARVQTEYERSPMINLIIILYYIISYALYLLYSYIDNRTMVHGVLYRPRDVVVFDPKQPKCITTTDLYRIDLRYSRNIAVWMVYLVTIILCIIHICYLYTVNFHRFKP